jgi:hypothetical protein
MNPLKVVILKDQTHLMGEVIELDEEPMYLIQSCYKLTDDDIVKFPLYTDQRGHLLDKRRDPYYSGSVRRNHY